MLLLQSILSVDLGRIRQRQNIRSFLEKLIRVRVYLVAFLTDSVFVLNYEGFDSISLLCCILQTASCSIGVYKSKLTLVCKALHTFIDCSDMECGSPVARHLFHWKYSICQGERQIPIAMNT